MLLLLFQYNEIIDWPVDVKLSNLCFSIYKLGTMCPYTSFYVPQKKESPTGLEKLELKRQVWLRVVTQWQLYDMDHFYNDFMVLL